MRILKAFLINCSIAFAILAGGAIATIFIGWAAGQNPWIGLGAFIICLAAIFTVIFDL